MADVSAIIANPRTKKAALVKAIQQLGPLDQPAAFWSAIANSADYNADHRRRAVFELVRRHVLPGTTLGELARLLDTPTWLDDDDIAVVTVLGGKIPVSWTFDDTVLVLSVHPGQPTDDDQPWAIYLRVEGQIDEASARAVLRGAPAPAAVPQAEILEVGFLPADPSRADA
jgi:hypothetical protein